MYHFATYIVGSFWVVSCDTSEGFFSQRFRHEILPPETSATQLPRKYQGVKLLGEDVAKLPSKNSRYSNLLEGVSAQFKIFLE